MKVSIITACRNSAPTLESCIQSVLRQDHDPIEYIVIDGQSTDETPSLLHKYKDKIARLISEKDKGMYFALNKGIQLATGEVIGFLHADDEYASGKIISRVIQELASKKTDSVYGDLQYVSKKDTGRVIRHWRSQPYAPELFLKGWMPPHPAFFVRKKCYDLFGAFNTSLSISADYELMLRFLYRHRISASYIPEVLVKMRTGGISNASFKSRIKANQEDRLAWKLNGLKPGAFTLIAKPLSKLRQFI